MVKTKKAEVDRQKMRMAFGKTIEELRRKRNMSQEDLSHVSGIGRPYISYLTTGRHCPTLHMIVKLARALETRPSRLFRYFEKVYDDFDTD